MAKFAFLALSLLVLSILSFQVQGQKVFAHYMMGNSYSQDVGDFATQIQRAAQGGIDAFALNIGPDDWMPDRVSKMFQAGAQNPEFRLFISLDMNYQYPMDTLLNYVRTYHDHPSSFFYEGKYFISTFAGEQLGNDVWQHQFKDVLAGEGKDIFFVPSFMLDPHNIFENNPVMDGVFDWHAWSLDNSYKNTDNDYTLLNDANSNGKIYMAGASPWFFTHFGGSWNKNWIYKSETLWTTRWEQICEFKPQLVEIITWNDFGESHYIGPIAGDLPGDDVVGHSSAWVVGFDHQAWFDLAGYYIQAYKTGSFPQINNDRVYYWYRTHSKSAQRNDNLGPPTGQDWAEDVVVVHTQLKEDAQIQVSIGGNVQYFNVPAGANTITAPFGQGSVVVTLVRDGSTLASQKGGIDINDSGNGYNFNAWVGQFSA